MKDRGGICLPIFLIMLWGQLFYALLPTWLEIPSYKYALVAAPLWCVLVGGRWGGVVRAEGKTKWKRRTPLLLMGVIVCLIPILLIRSLQQVDHFWRLPLWLHTLSVILATILTLWWAFGWERSKGLVSLVLLSLVLVPLPSVLETAIAGNLTRFVSIRVADLLPLMGYPIDLLGNAMLVKGNILDVSEGCSGLRSFQASFMLGLFLGEFYQCTIVRRLVLLAVGIGLAVLGNGARIFYLTTVAYTEGYEAEARVHDAAGAVAVTFIYGSIGLAAWWLSRDDGGAKLKVKRRRQSK